MPAQVPRRLILSLLIVALAGGFAVAGEFKVTPGKVGDGQKLTFQWNIDGPSKGRPWIHIFEAGHTGQGERCWDYWQVHSSPAGKLTYDPAGGVQPETGTFPLPPGKYQATLRTHGIHRGQHLESVAFEVTEKLTPAPSVTEQRVARLAKDFPWKEHGYRWKHWAGDVAPFAPTPSLPAVHDPKAPQWAYLQFRIRKALGDLARLYMTYRKVPAKGEIRTYNDSTWFMGWWPDYVVLTGDKEVRDYCYAWRDSFVYGVKNDVGNFYKGHVKKGDIDHQNEDVIRFLLRLWLIDPDDSDNSYNVLQMAQLLGNWKEGVPKWYDYQRHRWRGLWLGTEYVKDDNAAPMPFSWLCLVAMQAYRVTGELRYLELVEDFCGNQAADIARRGLKNPFLATAVWNSPSGRADGYGSLWGFGPWKGASFRLNGGLSGICTDLYQITGKEEYLRAAQAFVKQVMPDSLYHTRGMSGLGLICQYRRVTGDAQCDVEILKWIETTRDRVDSLHMITEPCKATNRSTDWLHGCETRNSASPKALNLAYLITGKEEYLDRAVEMALDRVRAIYSEEYRPSTRITSLGDWNWFSYIMAWEVADAFFPTTGKQYGGTNEGLDWYEVRFYHADGTQGLPRHVAAQHLPCPGNFDQRRLRFYNARDEAATVRARPEDVKPFTIRGLDGPDAASAKIDGKDVIVTIPPHQTIRLSIQLSRKRGERCL